MPYRARTLVAFTTDSGRAVPAGTEITVLERLPRGSARPQAYIIEASFPDETLVGGRQFDTAELRAEQLERLPD